MLARKIDAEGGKLIADYGSFKLYEVQNIDSTWLANTRAELRDDYNFIRLNTGRLDTTRMRTLSQTPASFSGKRLLLVQFAGPLQARWREELLGTGVQIISYIPENSYLVYGDYQNLLALQKLAAASPYHQWLGFYKDDFKINPAAQTVDAHGKPRKIGTDLFDIQIVADPQANVSTLNLLATLKLSAFMQIETNLSCLDVLVHLDPTNLLEIAARSDVVCIQPRFHRQEMCERQDQIIAGTLTNGVPNGPGYLQWLYSLGFTQNQFDLSGLVVDIADSGIDNGTTNPVHFGLYVDGQTNLPSRVAYARYEATVSYGTNSLEGCDGHGNLNAHIVAGFDDFTNFPFADGQGFHFGLGVCPFVRIGSSVIFDSVYADSDYHPNYNNLEAEAYRDGARIGANSWAYAGTQGAYDSLAAEFDALVRDAQPDNSTVPVAGSQQMTIVFAAGNDGPSGTNIDTPATAKNVISVGAADSVQIFGAPDRLGIPDDWATNANEIYPYSSRGPCSDGRNKPDLVAPGTHVSGGVAEETNDFVDFPDGLANPCFTNSNVEIGGGPDDSLFWPTNQQFYSASDGTSQAAACVAGGCALVHQYFINHFTNAPSPAMTKAFLMNSARYLTGATANDTLPSPAQGMGEMDLGMAFDGMPRVLSDQDTNNIFTDTGQAVSFTGSVLDTNAPFRITLAWTDAPGNGSGADWDNDLDLTVTVGGNVYKGNVFNGAFSVPGGSADFRNNVESVFLPAGVSGNYLVRVTAANINSAAVPNTNNAPAQDFALVIYNADSVPYPIMAPAGTTLVSESCQPTNGVIDPGEMVTINFALQNIGAAPTANVVATLLTNSGVHCVSGPQTYGALAPNGEPVSQPFTFTAFGSCGGTITATLQLQDGNTNLGTVNFTLGLGQFISATTFTENFDGVTPPALPSGWSSVASGAEVQWQTETNASDSGTNSVFVPDVANSGLSELISPVIPIVTTNAQLSFMNWYDLEAYPSESTTPQTAFDGGVLEISIGGGSFQDILAAGGSFAQGGYNVALDSPDNPLNGRMVWSGNSGQFIPTIVNLPPAAAGQNVQLRWSCGTDSSNGYGGTGWYLDTISILDGYYDCCSSTAVLQIFNPQLVGTNMVFSFNAVCGQSYSVQAATNLANPSWSTIQNVAGDGSLVFITNSAAAPQKFYRIISP